MSAFKQTLVYLFIILFGLSACGGGGGVAGSGSAASNDAQLNNLEVNIGQLDQVFQSSQLSYTASVAYLTSNLQVTATTANVNASLTINGVNTVSVAASNPLTLAVGINVIAIVVTAEDGITTQTYNLVITRQSLQSFAQQAYVVNSDTENGDKFGYSVALSGDTLAVGAHSERSNGTGVNSGAQADNSITDSGAVYVFTRSNGLWSQQAYIKASNTGVSDAFGYSLALSGDTLAVGARFEGSNGTGVNDDAQADNSASLSGAVYLFTRSNDVWSQQAYVKASNTEAGDFFGSSLALSGDTLAVGAYLESSDGTGVNGGAQADNSASGSGAVYVFTYSNGLWSQQAYVKASNTEAGDQFGFSVALSGDTLAVGARSEDSNGTGVNDDAQADNSAGSSGAVYVFTRSNGLWNQHAYVKASNTGVGDQFGWSLALSDETLAVGALEEGSNGTGVNASAQADNSEIRSGAVYVFTQSNGLWGQQAYIKASNTELADEFGFSLALSGDTLAVGTRSEDSNGIGLNGGAQTNNSATDSGAVYLFTRSNGLWSQQAYVKASNTQAGDEFATSLALSGETLAVGSILEGSTGTGAVYIFK